MKRLVRSAALVALVSFPIAVPVPTAAWLGIIPAGVAVVAIVISARSIVRSFSVAQAVLAPATIVLSLAGLLPFRLRRRNPSPSLSRRLR